MAQAGQRSNWPAPRHLEGVGEVPARVPAAHRRRRKGWAGGAVVVEVEPAVDDGVAVVPHLAVAEAEEEAGLGPAHGGWRRSDGGALEEQADRTFGLRANRLEDGPVTLRGLAAVAAARGTGTGPTATIRPTRTPRSRAGHTRCRRRHAEAELAGGEDFPRAWWGQDRGSGWKGTCAACGSATRKSSGEHQFFAKRLQMPGSGKKTASLSTKNILHANHYQGINAVYLIRVRTRVRIAETVVYSGAVDVPNRGGTREKTQGPKISLNTKISPSIEYCLKIQSKYKGP